MMSSILNVNDLYDVTNIYNLHLMCYTLQPLFQYKYQQNTDNLCTE